MLNLICFEFFIINNMFFYILKNSVYREQGTGNFSSPFNFRTFRPLTCGASL